jgi:hypothetical protein
LRDSDASELVYSDCEVPEDRKRTCLPYAPLDLAVVEHQAWRRDLHGDAPRALGEQQDRARIAEAIQGGVESHWAIALDLRDMSLR